jgi:ABC-type lipoprotein export system ATPase subunit
MPVFSVPYKVVGLDAYTKTRFWKCALQVNSSGYIAYRRESHGMIEEQYNQELLRVAQEQNIKVLGLADHGNVDSVNVIRDLMNQHDIVVFPGFELVSSEKAHFVCMFPENATRDDLIGYMAKLEIDTKDPTYPSSLSAIQILSKVDELKGFIYAAHCTDDNGVLRQKLHHVWQNSLLKAAQIPGTLDDLKTTEGMGYRQILLNNEPDYKREKLIAIINAKDVERPETLANPKASCVIKMTKPCFESFKLAFQYPQARVHLYSDVAQNYHTCIESLKITGGYLDGLKIEFSEHLNTVIGGRGTGKSTLLECIRYALQLKPIGKEAQKQHDDIIKVNLGNARIELVIRSAKMNNKCFTIGRRFGESASVKDDSRNISTFTPADLLPTIEIYGQNEIHEITRDKTAQRQLLNRFQGTEQQQSESRLNNALNKLAENRTKLIEAQAQLATIEDEVAKLQKLEEQLNQYTDEMKEKLAIMPLLEKEKQLRQRVIEQECSNLNNAFQSITDSLPDTVFLSETAIESLPHADKLRKMRELLNSLHGDAQGLLNQWQSVYNNALVQINAIDKEFSSAIEQEETALEKTFKELPALAGKSGSEIGVAYQNLLKEIERIRPKKMQLYLKQKLVDEFKQQRKAILDELSALKSEHSAQSNRAIKQLNKKLTGKLKLTLTTEADRQPVIDFLLTCNIESVGAARLNWIKTANDFSPVKLAERIQQGDLGSTMFNEGWGFTPTTEAALSRLPLSKTLELEELVLPDDILIELNTAHEGAENFKALDNLSTGQKCTAILHLLLLENSDPLLMDQPEDNLDNAFIADRIVTEIMSAKLARQFIFATHNANIPVFGDAEWIGVFEAQEGCGVMPDEAQGGIDDPQIRAKAANILEGGKTAFNQRKAMYQF